MPPPPIPATSTVYLGLHAKATSTVFDMGTTKVVNVVNPTDAQDAATKKYVDDEVAIEKTRAEGKEDELDTAITTETSRAQNKEDIITAKSLTSINILPTFAIMGGDPSNSINGLLPLLPPSSESYLDGWLVKKVDNTNKKVNLYFSPPTSDTKVQDLNALSMVILPRSKGSLPFITLYTPPTNAQTILDPSAWYGKRATWVVSDPNSITITTNPYTQPSYQLFTYVNEINLSGTTLTQVPPTDKQINSVPKYGFSQISMTLVYCTNYDGTNATLSLNDVIKFISIGTDSGATENQVNFVLNNFSYCSTGGIFQVNMDSSSLFNSTQNTENTQLQAKINDLNSSLLSLAQTLYGSALIPSIPFSFANTHPPELTG